MESYPETIGTFENATGKEFFFSSCDGCGARCCSGKENFVLAPLILEDFRLIYRYFPILFRSQEDTVKASILLNDGKNGCWYLKDSKCFIYDKRPPTCRQYPISSYYNALYVDTECPAVSKKSGFPLIKDLEISRAFQQERFENFREKLTKTDEFLNSLDPEKFSKLLNVAGVDLFVYVGENESEFIHLHKKSIHIHEKLLLSAAQKGN